MLRTEQPSVEPFSALSDPTEWSECPTCFELLSGLWRLTRWFRCSAGRVDSGSRSSRRLSDEHQARHQQPRVRRQVHLVSLTPFAINILLSQLLRQFPRYKWEAQPQEIGLRKNLQITEKSIESLSTTARKLKIDGGSCGRDPPSRIVDELGNDPIQRKLSCRSACSELREEDRRSRVLVSLWNRSDGRCEFLGCMSFGVKHLLTRRREVRGWYHLLSQGAGTRKHLQVNNMAAPAQPSSSGEAICEIAPII